MFTLAVAAMGRKVKAVDAGFVNHAYMRYNYLHYIYIIILNEIKPIK